MITEELLKQLHKTEVTKVPDPYRHSFKMTCSCGVEGLFFNEADAKKYEQYHLDRKRLAPY